MGRTAPILKLHLISTKHLLSFLTASYRVVKLSRVCPQINTSLKIAVCGRSCYKGVSTGSQFAMMTHKQTQKLNTLPFDTAVAEK